MGNTDLIGELRSIFVQHKNKVFIIDSITNQEFTYGKIEELSLKLATFISEKGIIKGDRIAIILPNCIEFIILYFSCIQIGAVPVPINIKLHKNEAVSILNECEPKLVFYDSTNDLGYISGNVLKNMKFIPLYLVHNNLNIEDNLLNEISGKDNYSPVSFRDVIDDDLFIIGYTSGTTNKSKGVMFSYKNIISNGKAFIKMVGLDSDSRFYEILSLSYTAGFYNLLFVPFLLGGSVVLDTIFDLSVALNFWKKVKKYNINVLWLVPSIVSMMNSLNYSSSDIEYCDDKNIKAVFSCTAPLSEQLEKSFESKFFLHLKNTYGLSELLFVSANLPNQSKNNGVGKIISGCKILIIDDNGKELPHGQTGEIVIKSDYLTLGYYKYIPNPTSIRNSFFLTGDVGFVSTEGYLYITDRKKDLIIRGGINISAAEIEEVIRKDNNINEVAVIGMPHELQGEEIVAVLNVNDKFSEKSLMELCRNYLASFKIPDKLLYIDEFPRGVTGKIQKRKLKEYFQNNFS